MRTSKLKTIFVRPGIGELLALHRADALGSGRGTDHVDYCEHLLKEWGADELNPPPIIDGHELMRRGIPTGPIYKQLLAAVREAQLEGSIKSKREALAIIDDLMTLYKQGQWPPVAGEAEPKA